MSQKTGDLAYIPIEQIRGAHVSLRKVNAESEKFLSLRDSIAQEGQILNPISVRLVGEGEDGEPEYEVIDGLQRYTAARHLNFSKIPCHVIDRKDKDMLFAQIIANTARINNTNAELANALSLILEAEPTLTKVELANRLARSQKWLDDVLSLNNLTQPLQDLVNDNKVKLTNAVQLAKLPQDEQENFVQRAMNDRPAEFGQVVAERLKEIRSERMQGKSKSTAEFTPVPVARRQSEIKDAYLSYTQKSDKSLGESVCADMTCTDAVEGFYAGLTWAVQMDPESIKVARQKYEDRVKAREEARERRRKEAQAAKEKEAADIEAGMKEKQEAAA